MPELRVGVTLLVLLLLTAAAAPLLAPYDPAEQLDPAAARYRPPGTRLFAVHLADGTWRLADRVERTPSGILFERLGQRRALPAAAVVNLSSEGVADSRFFLLGSDKFGRDVWSRLVWGARVSLTVGVLSVVLALTLGIGVGAAAALGGRALDNLLMRLVDGFLAFPRLFLLIALAALFDAGAGLLIVLLGATTWMGVSRLLRAELLSLKERDFIVAARASGLPPSRILAHHLLPNALTPVVVEATLLVGEVILAEAGLSFLGLGVPPPTPSWGAMISDGRTVLTTAWWVTVFPGLVLAVTIIALNLVGDGLRDRFDPRAAATTAHRTKSVGGKAQ